MPKPRKTLRRFTTGEYRFMPSRPSKALAAGVSNYLLLKLLTQEPEEKRRITWASCSIKKREHETAPEFIFRQAGFTTQYKPDLLSAISVVQTTLSTKLRGTRNVKQLRIQTPTQIAWGMIQFQSPKFAKSYPSCIDDQLKLK
jgi:hypothetical protein